jgi:hypothetical protein
MQSRHIRGGGMWYAAPYPIDKRHQSGADMEFSALFLGITVVMAVAWWGPRKLALALFAAVLIASAATYIHHATDALKLSF